MIQKAKRYVLVGSGFGLLVIVPYILGWMTIFRFKFAPINLNMPILYLQVFLVGVLAILIYKAWQEYKYGPVFYGSTDNEQEEAIEPTPAENGGMVLTDPETQVFEWRVNSKLSDDEVEAIKTYYKANRYNLTYNQLAIETKKYKDNEAIRGYLLNLRRIWGRKGFPQNKTLAECGYKFQN